MHNTYSINQGKQLKFDKVHVMAIINLTPDSFYDGGKLCSISDILKHVEMKTSQGATIIDIGAASSKPNAEKISVFEEINRLKEPLREIRKRFPDSLISVDTFSSQVAEFAIEQGADIINDISGGEMDAHMIDIVAKYQIPYVLMHMQGTPQTMQANPYYNDVVEEILNFFSSKIEKCRALGFEKLILDVGFGFGKTLEHNYQLLKNLDKFNTLGFPVLVGISRKSMINKVIQTTPQQALNGTTVLNTIALQNGASILRVHDVKEAKQAIDLVEFYKKAGNVS
jgi:dihydropteroate synthase